MKIIPFRIFKSKALPGNDPVREWKAMLAASAVLAFFCFCFAAYLFYAVGSGTMASSSAASGDSAALDPKEISAVIDAYNSAPARTQNLVSGGQFLVDPSR